MLDPHPLAEKYPPMSDDEFTALTEDVKANGCQNPVWTYEGKILDGRHRYRACRILGFEPVYAEFEGTADQAAAFVDSQNLHRRHLTAEFRRDRVRSLREQGMSVRAIAGELNIDARQVQRDLKAGVDSVHTSPTTPKPVSPKPAPQPATVQGRDGKQYPATRPTPASKPAPKPEPKPRCAWADVAKELAHVANLIESMGRITEEVREPWKLVESLETTAQALLRRARDLRKRHRL